jgi:hypothetical protein
MTPCLPIHKRRLSCRTFVIGEQGRHELTPLRMRGRHLRLLRRQAFC